MALRYHTSPEKSDNALETSVLNHPLSLFKFQCMALYFPGSVTGHLK
jgi:hypothetical protein